jgi:hypothetical protein
MTETEKTQPAAAADLLTPEQKAQMLANGRVAAEAKADDGNTPDVFPVVKLFVPWGAATWLLSELDPEDEDIAFGLCDLGFGCPELGSVREPPRDCWRLHLLKSWSLRQSRGGSETSPARPRLTLTDQPPRQGIESPMTTTSHDLNFGFEFCFASCSGCLRCRHFDALWVSIFQSPLPVKLKLEPNLFEPIFEDFAAFFALQYLIVGEIELDLNTSDRQKV